MRVVLDSNIFISALMTRSGPAGLIYTEWRRGRFELITSEAQLAEIRRVSHYPKISGKIPPQVLGGVLNFLQKSIYEGRVPKRNHCEDPDDAYLLDLAEASGADYLGDRESGLLQRGRVGRAGIVGTREFADSIGR